MNLQPQLNSQSMCSAAEPLITCQTTSLEREYVFYGGDSEYKHLQGGSRYQQAKRLLGLATPA